MPKTITTREVIEKAGGLRAISRACDVSTQAVHLWIYGGVPEHHVKTVAGLSKLSARKINSAERETKKVA